MFKWNLKFKLFYKTRNVYISSARCLSTNPIMVCTWLNSIGKKIYLGGVCDGVPDGRGKQNLLGFDRLEHLLHSLVRAVHQTFQIWMDVANYIFRTTNGIDNISFEVIEIWRGSRVTKGLKGHGMSHTTSQLCLLTAMLKFVFAIKISVHEFTFRTAACYWAGRNKQHRSTTCPVPCRIWKNKTKHLCRLYAGCHEQWRQWHWLHKT